MLALNLLSLAVLFMVPVLIIVLLALCVDTDDEGGHAGNSSRSDNHCNVTQPRVRR